MIVFFDDPGDGVRVTADTITTGGRSWPLGELGTPRTTRPPLPRALPRLVSLSLLAAFAVPVAWIAAGARAAAVVLCAAVVLLAAALLVARRPRAWELWADHRGAAVKIFSTTDPGRYGRVARALVRASDWRVLADDGPGPVDDDHVDLDRRLAQDCDRGTPRPGRDQVT
ncbi:membrane protein implicated in regulation of membrane protease activity [Catenuloplanes indicus]|uniref:Membrane protein implicated in regulation of membrane protease activity n=1 Tax=Catenuloplanes indicus TaxID=137267 RepID=A0AAE4B3M8_9ACTN|nr:membrane protein implicated in regulation of membrane protease activity [Catenuloplanes indicus]